VYQQVTKLTLVFRASVLLLIIKIHNTAKVAATSPEGRENSHIKRSRMFFVYFRGIKSRILVSLRVYMTKHNYFYKMNYV